MSWWALWLGCGKDTDTETGAPPTALDTVTSSPLPAPPTFELWECPITPEAPRDAWILRNVYTQVRAEVASVDVFIDGELETERHTSCPTSGDETRCEVGNYTNAAGVRVAYQSVTSQTESAASDVETVVEDAQLDGPSWNLVWRAVTVITSTAAQTDIDETWAIEWSGTPMSRLPADASVDATSFTTIGGAYDVDAASWAFGDCAWSVVDSHDRPGDGELYAISVGEVEVTVEREGERWLGYVDGDCVAEIDALTWASEGGC